MITSRAEKSTCNYCGETIRGRTDKKFCNDSCRNKYHYKRRRQERSMIRQINYRLRRNRRILEDLLKEGIKKIHRDELLRLGFDFRYYTHLYHREEDAVYKACYNVGYRTATTNFYECIMIEPSKPNRTS